MESTFLASLIFYIGRLRIIPEVFKFSLLLVMTSFIFMNKNFIYKLSNMDLGSNALPEIFATFLILLAFKVKNFSLNYSKILIIFPWIIYFQDKIYSCLLLVSYLMMSKNEYKLFKVSLVLNFIYIALANYGFASEVLRVTVYTFLFISIIRTFFKTSIDQELSVETLVLTICQVLLLKNLFLPWNMYISKIVFTLLPILAIFSYSIKKSNTKTPLLIILVNLLGLIIFNYLEFREVVIPIIFLLGFIYGDCKKISINNEFEIEKVRFISFLLSLGFMVSTHVNELFIGYYLIFVCCLVLYKIFVGSEYKYRLVRSDIAMLPILLIAILGVYVSR